MSDKMLALNELTGLVHNYEGTTIGGIGSDKTDMGVGIIPCGCDGFEEAVKQDTLVMIQPEHLERGVWKPAPCLQNDNTGDQE